MPFIKKSRKLLYNYSTTDDEEVNEKYTAVCWNDGANTQLAAVVNEAQQTIDARSKVITNKHSAARTAVEQACDMSSCFRTINNLLCTHTTERYPVHALRDRVKETFRKLSLDGTLNLKANTKNALVDFLSTYPTVLQKACPNDTVMKGFIRNGMIDDGSLSLPDLEQVLRSCQNSNLTKEHWDRIISNFPALYEEASKEGLLTDEFLTNLGFKPDTNYAGQVIERPNAISCESLHRAKSLCISNYVFYVNQD